MGANSRYRLSGDRRVFDYARDALERAGSRAAGVARSAKPTDGVGYGRRHVDFEESAWTSASDFRTRAGHERGAADRVGAAGRGRGFSSLGTIDRIVYDNYEPLIALAAAAAVTERIGLCTSVLLGPLRANAGRAGEAGAQRPALSGGRLTLGIGLGGRDDDYEVSGVETKGRGKRLDDDAGADAEIWDGDEVGPSVEGSPRLVIGGAVDASFARAARFGDGWIAGGSPPDQYAEAAAKVKAAWSEAGREGEPRLMGLAYFSLGDDAEADANAYSSDYYGWLGEEPPATSPAAPPRTPRPCSSTSPPSTTPAAAS